jgi:hypothetical protein
MGYASRIVKSAVAGSLLMFSLASTPSVAQGEPAYCRQWAREFCASIGVPGNLQCINYWTMRCEQAGGSPNPAVPPVLDVKLD